jgi:hypothetical protein
MNIKTYLPMGEKPPDNICRGFIAPRYSASTAHSFLQTDSLQEVQFYLALPFKSTSSTRLVVIILCRAAELQSPTPLSHAPTVSIITYPLPARPLTVILFFATTVTAAPNTAAHATVSTAATSTAVASFTTMSIAEEDATTATPPADEEAALHVRTSTAAAATSSTTTRLLIVNYSAAANVVTVAADAPPTIVCPSFAIPLAVTKDTTAAAAAATTTAYLPSAIHVATGATAAVDGSTTACQCFNRPPTVAHATLPAVTTHPVTLAHFTAETVTPNTAPSIVCTSTTDGTSSPATSVDPDASTVSVSWSIRCNHAVDRHQPLADFSTFITIPFPHVSFHITPIIHGNTSPLNCPARLIPHVTEWTARLCFLPTSTY